MRRSRTKGRHLEVALDTEDGDRRCLAAGAGERGVDVAVGVDGGIGDGMEIFGHGDGDAEVQRIAGGAVAVKNEVAGRWCHRECGRWRAWGG